VTGRGAAFACALAAAALVPARAWPCGGSDDSGSSSGSSSSSGGGSSSSDSSSSGSTSAPACVDASVVTGHKQCESFARWDVSRWPRMQIGFGTSVHSFSTADMTFEGTAEHDRSISYIIVDDDLRRSRAVGGTFDMRITGNLGRWFYTGFEVGIGGAAVANPRTMNTASDLKLEPSRGALYLSGGALLGIAIPVDRYRLHAETFAGARTLGLSTTTEHGDCVDESVAWAHDILIESRAGVQTWLGPWWTATAWIGSDLRERADVSFGVMLQGHVRAFDGGR